MNDYTALLHRIVRSLHDADGATIDNAIACIWYAESTNRCSDMLDYREAARKHLDKAAQYCWGSVPPEGIRVDDKWHYTVTF